jgi:hypothetical protein
MSASNSLAFACSAIRVSASSPPTRSMADGRIPTHTHPHAPDTSPGNVIPGPVAARSLTGPRRGQGRIERCGSQRAESLEQI